MAACQVNLLEDGGSIPPPATKIKQVAEQQQRAEKDTLTLTIKGEYLEQIISGEKTVEYRDCTDFYIDRFCILKKNGEFKAWKPIRYIIFRAGRNKAAKSARVELRRIAYEEWLDEKTGAPLDEYTFALYLGKVLAIDEEKG